MGKAGGVLAVESRSVRSSIAAILVGMAALVGLGVPGTAHAAKIGHRTLSNGVDVILIMGAIERGDDEVFRALSIQHKEAIVVLESDGGALAAAIEIGKIVRLAGYSTLVMEDDVCASSCALIWLAGSPRALSSKGRVGFHASYRDKDGKMEETGVGNALVGHYLTLLNLPQRAIIFATMASPDKISWLSSENRADAGIEFEDFEAGERNEASRRKADATRNRGADEDQKAPPVVITNTLPPAAAPEVVVIPPPVKQMSKGEISKIIRESLIDPVGIRERFLAFKLGEENFDTFRNYFFELAGNKNYIDKLTEEVQSSLKFIENDKNGIDIGRAIGEAFNKRMFYKGLARMSNEDIRQFVKYFVFLADLSSDRECSAFFRGDLKDPGFEYRMISSAGKQEFAGYLSLYHRGIDVGVSGRSPEILLTTEQQDAAGSAYRKHLEDRILALPEVDQRRVARAIDNPDQVSDKDACDGRRMLFSSMYNMDGILGDWRRRNFVIGFTKK